MTPELPVSRRQRFASAETVKLAASEPPVHVARVKLSWLGNVSVAASALSRLTLVAEAKAMLESTTPLNCCGCVPETRRTCHVWLVVREISNPLSRAVVAAEASGATRVASRRMGSSSLDLMPTNVHSIKNRVAK